MKKSFKFKLDIFLQKCYTYPIIGVYLAIIKLKKFKTCDLKEVPPSKFNWKRNAKGTDAIECHINDLYYVSGKFHDSLYLYNTRVLTLTGLATIGDRKELETEVSVQYDTDENLDLDKLAENMIFSFLSAKKDKNQLNRYGAICWNRA